MISIAALVVSFNGNIMAKLTGKANDDFSSVGFKGDDFSSLSPVSAVSDYPLEVRYRFDLLLRKAGRQG